jgi:phospholipid/cholesterol/gamma-HCH transport system permease protein
MRASLEFLGSLGYLLADTVAALPAALFTRRGRRLGWSNLWSQMNRVGVSSIPIVSLVLFCIGAILAFQMAPVLATFGMVSMLADIVSVAIFRELGPLVSAIVLTGFAGAAIAAEIGTMVISEEIEALQAHAIDPIRFLVVPRVLATVIMMICIALVGDLLGIFGGFMIATTIMRIAPEQYVSHTFAAVQVRDFLTGLVKAGVFGLVISLLACFLGLRVTGGAQGVGIATSRTVVLIIVALIAVDLLFTGTFYAFGW